MGRLVSRKPVEININSPLNGYLPIYDGDTRLWESISSSSLFDSGNLISGSEQVFLTGTTGYNDFSSSYTDLSSSFVELSGSYASNFESASFTGSYKGDGSQLYNIPFSGVSGLSFFSSSVGTQINALEIESGSIRSNFNSFTSSYNTGSFTGSFKGDGSGIYNVPITGITDLNKIYDGNVSASISQTNGLRVNTDVYIDGTLTAKEIHTDYVTSSVLYQSGSTKFGDTLDDTHQFTGSLYVSGGATIVGDIIVSGTAYYNYVTASTLLVNDNWITVTTTSSLGRFGGIRVLDYEGINETASFAWDTLADRWLEVVPNHDTYSSSLFIMGPKNSGSLGNETGLITNRIPKADDEHHIVNSEIIDNGSEIILGRDSIITGSLRITGNVTALIFTGSFIGDGNGINNIPITGVTELPAISSSLDNRLDSLEAYSSSQLVPSASMSFRTLQIDVYCKNQTGVQINKGTVVRINGSIGDNPLISVADVTTESSSANTLGITTQNIPNDDFGTVITEGVLIGVNTSGMTAGQLLYLGSNGIFTTTEPIAPNHTVRLGEVLRVHPNVGSIYVRIDNGSELGEGHNVLDTTTNSSYGDLLVKSGSVWTNSKDLIGDYNITGSLVISQNLTVLGSSSLLIVTSSQIALSSSFLSLNVFEPAERFGGIKVYDSGSLSHLATASLAWDSLRNHWVYQNASGSSYSGGMLLAGPRNTGSLGDEPSLISGRIVKSVGGDHIDVSIISETGTTITVAGDLVANSITGAFDFYGLVNRPTLVSGSEQIDITGTTGYSTFSSSLSSSIGELSSSVASINLAQNNRLDSIEGVTSSLNTFSSSIDTTIKNKLNSDGVISGSSQIIYSGLTGIPSDIVSGSSQISNLGFAITGSNHFKQSQVITGSLTVTSFISGSLFNSVPISRGKGDLTDNIAVGEGSLNANTVGYANTAVGFNVLSTNQGGSNNTAYGKNSLSSNIDGTFNTAIGLGALSSNTNGGRNTAIGYNAGVGLSIPLVNGYNNIFLGSRSEGEGANESNRTWIGNTDTTTTWLGGELLLGTRTSTDGAFRATIVGNTQITGSAVITSNLTASLVSASFKGDGSRLYNIPASGVTGLELNKIVSGPISASLENSALRVNTDVYIDGIITAKEIHTDYVTSSVLFQSGSTKFGDTSDDIHQFTGSLSVSGSMSVTDIITGTITNATNAVSSSYPFVGNGTTIRSFNTSNNSVTESFIVGLNAGYNATGSWDLTAIGTRAAYEGYAAESVIAIGYQAGYQAKDNSYSIFLGQEAGYQSTTYGSIYMGGGSGYGANADSANFIGYNAGIGATRADFSNFIGVLAGHQAQNASGSNFIGSTAGKYQTGSAYSNYIGYNVANNNSTTNYLGRNNIIIGNSLTLPTNSKDSINIGGLIFGTGSFWPDNNMVSDPFPFSGSANGKIGINQPAPQHSLDVVGSIKASDSLIVSSSQITNKNVNGLLSGNQTISTILTGSYTSAFYNYSVTSGSNARAGQIMVIWNGTTITYTDNSTMDIGLTKNVELTASLSTGNVVLSTILPTDGWTIKTLVNLL